MSTTTNDMSLVVPVSGDTDYATSISSSFTLIDDHDHTTGKGVQVGVGGIAASAVTTATIAAGAVTQAKRAALGQQISSSSGFVNVTGTTPLDVLNLSVTITTTGRPVFIGLIPDGSTAATTNSALSVYDTSGGAKTVIEGQYYIVQSPATNLANVGLRADFTSTVSTVVHSVPCSSLSVIAPLAAGTYTFKIQAAVGVSASTVNCVAAVNNAKLIAYEL